TGDCLFDDEPTGLYVLCARCLGLWRSDFPSFYTCFFQGFAVPWCRICYSCHVRRTGYAQYGRHLEENPDYLCRNVDRLAGFGGYPVVCRIFLQGSDFGGRLCRAFTCWNFRLLVRNCRRLFDGVLLMAALVHDVPRQAAR